MMDGLAGMSLSKQGRKLWRLAIPEAYVRRAPAEHLLEDGEQVVSTGAELLRQAGAQ